MKKKTESEERDRAMGGVVAGLAVCLLVAAPVLADSRETCEDGSRPWPWIGNNAYHCPGGSCFSFSGSVTFDVWGDGEAQPEPEVELGGTVTIHDAKLRVLRPGFDFSSEPRLRGIDPDGPAERVLEEGDVLVAVNGYLITTMRGGEELASLSFDAPAELTLRRGDRLLSVEVWPEPRCGSPLALSGDRILVALGGPKREVPGMVEQPGVGMGLECDGCSFNPADADAPWSGTPRRRRLVSVQEGSAAWEAGLRRGDVLVSVDGLDLETVEANQRLFRYLLARKPEDPAMELRYRRDGEERTTRLVVPAGDSVDASSATLTLERKGDDWGLGLLNSLSRLWGNKQSTGVVSLGVGSGAVTLPTITMSGESWGPAHLGLVFTWCDECSWIMRDGTFRWNLPEYPEIVDVESGGPADRAGLRIGDVLTHVNNVDLKTEAGGRLLLENREGAELDLRIVRDGQQEQMVLVVE